LAALGFDAAWCVLGADAVGAPHQRNRLWLLAKAVADTDGERLPTPQTESLALEEFVGAGVGGGGAGTGGGAIWWGIEPRIRRVVDGYAARLDRSAGQPFARQLAGVENGVRNRVSRIRGLGNAQVPICATIAFLALKKLLETHSQ
jgi:DNA (cytosine-5)-methyltransferase 1